MTRVKRLSPAYCVPVALLLPRSHLPPQDALVRYAPVQALPGHHPDFDVARDWPSAISSQLPSPATHPAFGRGRNPKARSSSSRANSVSPVGRSSAAAGAARIRISRRSAMRRASEWFKFLRSTRASERRRAVGVPRKSTGPRRRNLEAANPATTCIAPGTLLWRRAYVGGSRWPTEFRTRATWGWTSTRPAPGLARQHPCAVPAGGSLPPLGGRCSWERLGR